MPTIQPGIRIRWDLDQRIRAYIRKHGGTMREHYEAALEDYLKAREG